MATFATDPLAVCEAAARAGGQVLREHAGRLAEEGVMRKGPGDFVTAADYASQREVRRILLEAFPDHGFVGEENDGLARGGSTGLRWIVDPLDGTTNFVHGFPAYCVSIALADGETLLVGAIYDPVRNECFTARRGAGAFRDGSPIRVPQVRDLSAALVAVSFPPQVAADSAALADFVAIAPHTQSIRRTGSTAINLAYLACGRLHGFWARRIACWDVAAGFLIVQEAGGVVESLASPADPPALDDPAFIAGSSPELVVALRGLLAPAAARG